MREVVEPGELRVLTWGSDIYDDPYLAPIKKALQGQNPGHGAFVIELPETLKNKVIFSRLMALGYPGDVIKVPKVVEVTGVNGERVRKTVPGEYATRYVIRFSPYYTEFSNAISEGRYQKAGRYQPWDKNVFEKMKSSFHILDKKDLNELLPGKNKEALIELLFKHQDVLVDEETASDFIRKQIPDAKNPDRLAKSLLKKVEENYREYFSQQLKSALNKLPDRKKKEKLDLLVKEALSGRKYGAFKKDSSTSSPSQILHLEGLKNASPEMLENLGRPEAAEMLYQSFGQSPDRIIAIPFKTKEFQYGLDIKKLTDEMVKVKLKSNQKMYKYVIKREDAAEKKDRERIEKELINAANQYTALDIKEPFKFSKYFEAYTMLKLMDEGTVDLEKDAKEAIRNFEKLWKKILEKIDNDDVFIQNAMHEVLFNCCRWTKDCLRAGVDNTYKGHLSEPWVIGTFTTPSELANEAAELVKSIQRDQVFQEKSQVKNDPQARKQSFNKPPFWSRVRGVILRLQHNNFELLPSRSIIRPVMRAATAAWSMILSPFKIAKSTTKAVVIGDPKYRTKAWSDKELSATEKADANSIVVVIDKVLNFNKDSEPFLMSRDYYDRAIHFLKGIEDNQSDLIKFKIQYDKIQQEAFKAISEKANIETVESMSSLPSGKRNPPVVQIYLTEIEHKRDKKIAEKKQAKERAKKKF